MTMDKKEQLQRIVYSIKDIEGTGKRLSHTREDMLDIELALLTQQVVKLYGQLRQYPNVFLGNTPAASVQEPEKVTVPEPRPAPQPVVPVWPQPIVAETASAAEVIPPASPEPEPEKVPEVKQPEPEIKPAYTAQAIPTPAPREEKQEDVPAPAPAPPREEPKAEVPRPQPEEKPIIQPVPEPIRAAQPVTETGPVREPEPIRMPEPVREPEVMKVAEPVREPEPVFTPEPIKAPEPVTEAFRPSAEEIPHPVSRPQATTAQEQSLNEKLYNPHVSLNERLGQSQVKKNLADKLKLSPIADLRTAISINQKAAFINYLFKGDDKEFRRVLNFVNDCKNYSEAKFFLQNDIGRKYDWLDDDGLVQEFMELVYRKFL